MKTLFLLAVICISAIAQSEDPYRKVEKAHLAAVAKHNSPEAIGELYDRVIENSQHVTIPSNVIATLRPLVVQAELNYRNGKGTGISEDQVVKAFNDLATALNLPRYDLITKSHMEYGRQADFIFNPAFMSYMRFKKGQKQPSSQLSPLQAIFVFTDEMNAKFFSPELTQTPEEWESWYVDYRAGKRRAPDYLVGTPHGDAIKKAQVDGANGVFHGPTDRHQQTADAIDKAIANMTEAQGAAILFKVASDLGLM